MKKMYIVTHCSMCPNRSKIWFGTKKNKRMCYKKNKLFDPRKYANNGEIPTWCPLPDAPSIIKSTEKET